MSLITDMNREKISLLRYHVSGFLATLLQLLKYIGIPVMAYIYHNWWFLFGIPSFMIGFSIGWRMLYTPVIIYVAILFIASYFKIFNQLFAFYYICFGVGFLGIRLYRAIGFGG